MNDNPFNAIAAAARAKTNEQLGDELARLMNVSRQRLDTLLPAAGDKERAAKLMTIVNAKANEAEQIANFQANISELGGVALRLLKLLA